MEAKLNYGISKSKIKELSTLNPWKSTLVIIAEWFVIISSILFHFYSQSSLVYLFICIIISTRLYAFYSLLHDAIHYSIFRNKWLNDIFSQIFLGLPLFISIKEIRKVHLAHHKFLQTENDPEILHLNYNEFQFPKHKYELLKILVLDITGINFLKYRFIKLVSMFSQFRSIHFKQILKLISALGIILITYYFNVIDELMLYWFIPYATMYQLFNRLRLSTEHFNLPNKGEFNTRSVVPTFWEQLILSPHNLGYHLEHHLFPGVPFYNLPELHSLLMKNSRFSEHAIFETSYINIVNEYIKHENQ